jgi:multiple antibiotic resistance protein
MLTFMKYLSLAFSALLPVVNPVGSSLVFLSLVGIAPVEVTRDVARRVALTTALFLLTIDLLGAVVLTLFDLSLPVIQVAGGFVLLAMGWRLLNQEQATPSSDISSSPSSQEHLGSLKERVFYPFTFPVTAGPGCIVVTLTLSAHASHRKFLLSAFAHAGILAAIILLSVAVYLCYAYAQKITEKVSRQTAHGILRIVAFILVCIGAQIAWNGMEELIRSVQR